MSCVFEGPEGARPPAASQNGRGDEAGGGLNGDGRLGIPSPVELETSLESLPPEELVKALVVEAYDRFKSNIEGQNSQVDPALAEAPRLMCPRNRIGASENVA